MTPSKWSTVSFVKDAPKNIRRFVSYHLALGADHMHLFFDDPDDPSIKMVGHLERVTAVACDRSFWKSLLNREVINRHGRRQNSATTWGYHQVKEGWVLNLDADEFFHCTGKSVSSFLAGQPENIRVIRIRPAERILTAFDNKGEEFRLPLGPDGIQDVYGDFSKHLAGRNGFFGHADGKSFIRAGLADINLRQHWPVSESEGKLMDLDIEASRDLCILHRNAEDYSTWRGKLDFRLSNVSIPGHLRVLLAQKRDAGDEEAIRTCYNQVFSIDEAQRTRLSTLQALVSLPSRLDSFEREFFP